MHRLATQLVEGYSDQDQASLAAEALDVLADSAHALATPARKLTVVDFIDRQAAQDARSKPVMPRHQLLRRK